MILCLNRTVAAKGKKKQKQSQMSHLRLAFHKFMSIWPRYLSIIHSPPPLFCEGGGGDICLHIA